MTPLPWTPPVSSSSPDGVGEGGSHFPICSEENIYYNTVADCLLSLDKGSIGHVPSTHTGGSMGCVPLPRTPLPLPFQSKS